MDTSRCCIAGRVPAAHCGTICITLWKWLVRGVLPKTQLDTVLRKIRALMPVSWSSRAKGLLAHRAAAVSGRLLQGGSLADLVLHGGSGKAHKEERVSLLMEVSKGVARVPEGCRKDVAWEPHAQTRLCAPLCEPF
jgi:hypothetical protein